MRRFSDVAVPVSLPLTFLAVLLAALPCQAQLSSTGTLSGTVTDKSGAVVPGASVVLHNTNTGVDITTESNNDGSFVVPGLPVGEYAVSLSKPGFQSYLIKGIAIHPTVVSNVSAVMEVGQEVARVTVTASPIQVETSTGEISNQISESQVVALPLNGRNYQSLSALVPGGGNGHPAHRESVRAQPASAGSPL